MECWGCLFSQRSSKAFKFWEGITRHRTRGRGHNVLSMITRGEKRAKSRANSVHWLRRTSERKEKEWGKPKLSRQAIPSHSVQSVQPADLVASARGGGGIERGRGGERERRRRRGGSVVAVCGIGTLSGSWRGWERLNHPWQWSVWLRRSRERDEGEGARP